MSETNKKEGKIGQEQFHAFVFEKNVSWQEIIYDLINSEQLDPWDINLSTLSQRYLEKVRELEEANFRLSGKVLLVASLMLRIKSELLMNKYIKDLDDVLFSKDKKEEQTRLELEDYNDDEMPELLPRTPLPRFKKVNIQELILALNKAIKTETRREDKKQAERESYERTKLFIPKKTISLIDKIKQVHEKIKLMFQEKEKIPFSEFAGAKKEDKISHFIPLLHLDNSNKLWLQQYAHFDEIWIHKDGEKFIQKDDIIVDEIARMFEEKVRKN